MHQMSIFFRAEPGPAGKLKRSRRLGRGRYKLLRKGEGGEGREGRTKKGTWWKGELRTHRSFQKFAPVKSRSKPL